MSFSFSAALASVLNALLGAGGRPYIVGGAVRDAVLGRVPKDFDIEVFGLDTSRVEAALAAFKVNAVGRSFGVYKVTVGDETFDIALPRRDSKTAPGHRGFVVTPDPWMSFADAAARRDFTMNAIGWNVDGQCFEDPHGGCADLQDGVLRHVSEAFGEDPLRVLRGCQFTARFGLRWHPQTLSLCQRLVPELHTLPVERLWAEWQKLLLQSPRPSLGLDALLDTGAIALWPELHALLHVPQDPQWHPEGQGDARGSLWVHNGMVVDQAVRVLADDGVVDDEERLITLLGALCHDFGKPATTQEERGRWRALGHEEAGAQPTRAFLERLGCPVHVRDAVVPLVQHHLKPFQLAKAEAGDAAIRRLATKVPLVRLTQVARADFLGRTTEEALAVEDSQQVAPINWLLSRAEALNVRAVAPRPLLQGRHLLALGWPGGPALGGWLKRAFEAQLEGVFSDEAGALQWAREHVDAPSNTA